MKSQAQAGNIRRTACKGRLLPNIVGRSFGSLLERAVGEHLAAREHLGEIEDLQFQVTVELTRARVHWRVDFCYVEKGQLFYHEAKGRDIEPYPTKLKLFRVYGPAPLRISKGSAARHRITETIYPKDWLKEMD